MTDLDYRTLQHAIPTLDMILTAALHDRRVGWSDRAIYQSVTDAVAASSAEYRIQRVCLSLLRNELGIPDSIEDGPNQRRGTPSARRIPENDSAYGVRTLASSQGVTAPFAENERRAA